MNIKSKTDVITNSSSEVFIIKRDELPEFTNSDYITIDDIECHIKFEKGVICRIMNWDPEDTGGVYTTDNWGSSWYWPTVEIVEENHKKWICPVWEKWCEDHRQEMDEKLSDLVWVDIEDHYSNWEEDADEARYVCLWHENRH